MSTPFGSPFLPDRPTGLGPRGSLEAHMRADADTPQAALRPRRLRGRPLLFWLPPPPTSGHTRLRPRPQGAARAWVAATPSATRPRPPSVATPLAVAVVAACSAAISQLEPIDGRQRHAASKAWPPSQDDDPWPRRPLGQHSVNDGRTHRSPGRAPRRNLPIRTLPNRSVPRRDPRFLRGITAACSLARSADLLTTIQTDAYRAVRSE
jgi:hypothetical protein